jgi:hypothetical protein
VLSQEDITAIVEYERSLTQDVDPTFGEAPVVAVDPDEDEE